MQSYAVVKADDVFSDISYAFNMIGVVSLLYAFHLEIQEEPLHDSVIPAVPLSAHARTQSVPV